MPSPSLYSYFSDSCKSHPNKIAFEVNEQSLSYKDAEAQILSLASAYTGIYTNTTEAVSLCGYRSMDTLLGVYSILASGKFYLPLNPNAPAKRNLQMLKSANCKTIVYCEEASEHIAEIAELANDIKFILISNDNKTDPPAANKGIEVRIASKTLQTTFTAKDPHRYAYLLFTSGSSGTPKGVLVTQKNVRTYVNNILTRFDLSAEDRFAQMVDLTFDLSAHDLFCAAAVGATLCVVPTKERSAPGSFLRSKKITTWLAVPSVSHLMGKIRQLKPGLISDLKLCFFCGEPLLETTAKQWLAAAPNATVVNIYGPTEATIAISEYIIPGENMKSKNGIVSIGQVFDDHKKSLIEGELCLTGDQISDGYINNPKATDLNFIAPNTYKTGDLVEEDDEGDLFYISRKDNQVKVHGHRIELQEIDHVLQDITSCDIAATVVVRNEDHSKEELVSFISNSQSFSGGKESVNAIITKTEERLPDYMVPKYVFFRDNLPLNKNGKLDRKALQGIAKDLI